MRPHAVLIAIAACLLAVPANAGEAPPNPYAGQQTRPIKALSEEDVSALRQGAGMGLAKAAELNGYPGPMHVLELGDRLGLSAEQRDQVSAIRERMSVAARAIGETLIAREAALDLLFAQGDITSERLAAGTSAIGEAQGQLRAIHLAAHLETRALLNAHQLALYQQLRGYGGAHRHRHG